ncbi:MAG: PfkB family carbohydrate kinase [Prolixibacteraceae bacterium]|jgi:ribokinase|nr:PfkB family carbohydrate kinase [Prolixibacteraceae bacterium]
MKRVEIAGLGFCGLDYLSILPHIPVDEKVEIIQSLVQGGGPAATAIVTAARLGARTAFIGAVGNDDRGSAIIDGLKLENVDTGNIQMKAGKESPAAFCWIEKESGKRSIAWTKGTSLPLDVSKVDPEFIKSLKLLHLDGHNTEAAIKAACIAKENGVIVSLDAGTLLPDIEKLVALADICIASESFARKYTGESDIQKAAEVLFKSGCIVAAVTSGKNGVFAVTANGTIKKDAFQVPVIDTTGAGDVFHGAFAFAYIQGWAYDYALDFASATAALKCTEFGGRTGIPSADKVFEFLQTKKVNR